MMKNIFLGTTVAILFLCGNAMAQAKPTSDEKAVFDLMAQLARTWEVGDVIGFTDLLADNVVSVSHFGEVMTGRESVRTKLQWVRDVPYKKAKIKMTISDVKLTFVTPDLAVVTSRIAEEIPAGPKRGDQRSTFMCVRVNGKWQVAQFQSVGITDPPKMN
ncbi:MAG: SgcJ/EcaC family oxidoreductase [Pyrinomonadaceae bacterium]